MFDFQRKYAASFDSDQGTARGYYSNGLVVVGHVEIPALPQARTTPTPLERAELSRRKASRKDRGPRRPKLDAWLDKQDLNATAKELFQLLPDADAGTDLYRDGDNVIEVNRKRELPALARSSFGNAVSRARNRSRLTKAHS